jgi:hypothetical protein
VLFGDSDVPKDSYANLLTCQRGRFGAETPGANPMTQLATPAAMPYALRVAFVVRRMLVFIESSFLAL